MIMTWVRGRCWRRFSRTGTPGGFRDARMPGCQRVSWRPRARPAVTGLCGAGYEIDRGRPDQP